MVSRVCKNQDGGRYLFALTRPRHPQQGCYTVHVGATRGGVAAGLGAEMHGPGWREVGIKPQLSSQGWERLPNPGFGCGGVTSRRSLLRVYLAVGFWARARRRQLWGAWGEFRVSCEWSRRGSLCVLAVAVFLRIGRDMVKDIVKAIHDVYARAECVGSVWV